MALTNRTIPQLFNGVSRQPAILRSIDQTESELNSWAAASSGVGKRPPTEFVARLSDALTEDAFVHIINRDVTERYVVVIDGTTIRVFDFDGDEKTVNAPGGTAYLDGAELTAVTVADFTFLVNRNKVVLMKAIGADTATPPDYLRTPVRAPGYNEDDDVPVLSGRPGYYAPNQTYV